MAGRPNLGKTRIQVKISPEGLAAIDAARGKQDRSTFIETFIVSRLPRQRRPRKPK